MQKFGFSTKRIRGVPSIIPGGTQLQALLPSTRATQCSVQIMIAGTRHLPTLAVSRLAPEGVSMKTLGKLLITCAALGVAAAGLSGCASAAADAAAEGNPVTFEQSVAQVDALADGVVSRAEYQAGFADYRACMAERGHTVIVLDDMSTIIDMRIPAEAVESGVDHECYQTQFRGVDEAWQIANQDQRADNALLDACLRDRDLQVPQTRQEKVDALVAAGVDLGTCLPS